MSHFSVAQMSTLLPSQNTSSGTWRSLLLGSAVAFFIMLLVPLTQIMQPVRSSVESIEAVELASPPPPPALEDPPPPPPPKEEPPPPELKTPPPMPTLDQLEVSLNPGTGGDLSLGLTLGFDFSTESADQLEQLFGFGELDEVPRLVREGRFRYPPNAPRGRGEAFVRVLVHVKKDGRVAVQRVIDFSHQELIDAARRMAEDSRFSAPMRNGQPVLSKYEWTLRIPLQ